MALQSQSLQLPFSTNEVRMERWETIRPADSLGRDYWTRGKGNYSRNPLYGHLLVTSLTISRPISRSRFLTPCRKFTLQKNCGVLGLISKLDINS